MSSGRALASIPLALLLASCAGMQQGSGQLPAAGATTPIPRISTTANAAVVEGTELADTEAAQAALQERQALVDAINRDGQPPALRGFREAPLLPGQSEGENVVELNYEQADLRTILEELGGVLELSMVIDPSIDSQVSMRTSAERPLRREDIWPLLRLLTREAGVSLEQVGNIWYARQQQSNLPQEITLAQDLGAGSASMIMQITPLVYISVQSALELLQPLLEPGGRVTRINNTNTLALTALESQLVRVNELLALVDSDPFQNQGIQLYQLQHANAADLATELTDILNMIEGDSPAYQVRGLERINALLVTAPANRGFTEISRWVRILDAEQQEQSEQLFHYRVKNLNSQDLAATLTEVFSLDEEEQAARSQANARQQFTSQGLSRLQTVGADGLRAGQNAGADTAAGAGSGSGSAAAATGGTDSTAPAAANAQAISANLQVSIVADVATNSLLIRSNPRDYRQLLTTINQLDSVPLQVMINAVIAQITLTNETRFGVDWSRIAENAALDDISTTTTTNFLPGNLGGLLFTKSFLDGAARVEATLEAIATNNDVRLLARPSLTVLNNQEGNILIGSQIPVQSGQETTVGGNTVRNIQFRDTGIRLTITPRINADGVVNLTISQELSSVDANTGIDNNPIFQNQEITTTVVVRDGENIVLGGLIQSNASDLNTGVPGLNRIPGLGRLFSFQEDIEERKELFIVLRPEIVNLNDRDGSQYQAIVQRFELVAEIINDQVL
ncbi:MAG: type II secretion system secretin GspD [Pseudomonadales bacterium]|nr:type II secretion system secretin GspD [Pseudomonadales bacterium]